MVQVTERFKDKGKSPINSDAMGLLGEIFKRANRLCSHEPYKMIHDTSGKEFGKLMIIL